MILLSGTVWLVGCVISALYMYFVVFNNRNDPTTAKAVNIFLTFLVSILPLVIIGVLHVFKARILRASLAACKRNTTKQMSKIVTIVIVGYIITTTPIATRDIINIGTTGGYRYDVWMVIFGHVGRLMLFLNYTINPFIYFVHSDQLKKYANCFRGKTTRKPTSGGTNVGSSQTQKKTASEGPSVGSSKTSVSHISDGGINNVAKEPATTQTYTDLSGNESVASDKL